MRADPSRRPPLGVVLALAGVAASTLASAPPASAAAPAPCDGGKQITDVARDGHHDNTDVLSAWLSERAGRLQAVVEVRQGRREPAHDDSDAASFALLFESGGQWRYVRAEAPLGAATRYDHGTWTRSGGFASAGATSGETVTGEKGTVTIDVPGVAAGAVLGRPFVLTYDGGPEPDRHWVDRAPGGTTPDGTEFGADHVAGACAATAGGGSSAPSGPGGPGGSAPGGGGAVRTTAVALDARRRLTGGGTLTVSGRVVPARGGVPVELTTGARRATVRRLTTAGDGTFSARVPIGETSRLRAVAEGIGSESRIVTVRSTVSLTVRRTRGGGATLNGRVSPRLPGRILLLRGASVRPTATTTARQGRFRLRLKRARPGRYQAVFVPSGNRAERSTSKSGVLR